MRVLGIGGSSHDFASCIVEDGKVLIAIEEERISREKQSRGQRSKTFSGIQYCLENANLCMEDIDLIISNNLMKRYHLEKICKQRVFYINHHLAHAASTYYTSGLYDSAILVIDGTGDQITASHAETVTYGYGYFENIYTIDKKLGKQEAIATKMDDKKFIINYNSLGYLYDLTTGLCGFSTGNQGKTMGLAAYGTAAYYKDLKSCIKYSGGQINMDLQKILDFIHDVMNVQANEEEQFNIKANVAYSVQKILEDYVILFANELYERTKSKNLCLAGGVMLNSSINGKLLLQTPFDKIHVFPAAGDSGTSVGAALYGYYFVGQNKYNGSFRVTTACFGKTYLDSEIEAAANQYKGQIKCTKKSKQDLLLSAAEDLKNGKIIGWFQGGSEFGPRALGNRSILANPSIKNMKDIINQKVKYRESFRPFAPSILENHVDDYFEYSQKESNFMLFICKVKKHVRQKIASVIHIDNTARIQTITLDKNGIFYELVKEFYDLTGIPIVLNTSFNIKGEPIVETPEQAIEAFLNSQIDVLYMNTYMIQKHGA